MAETLVRAAVTVLSQTELAIGPHVDPRDALAQSVSLFLRSLQHFPRLPLDFALETYRDFFVLVARWRSEQDREDARHTIDRARRWLEESTAEQREALDLQLVSEPWFFGGPCALTTQFLTCILEENSGAGSADETATVLKLLFDSLEVATDNPTDRGEMRFAILRLLAILLDALDEIGLVDRHSAQGIERLDDDTQYQLRVARLLVNLVWRAPEAYVKSAAGIFDRLRERDILSWHLSYAVTQAILDMLRYDISAYRETKPAVDPGLLCGIDVLFQSSIDMFMQLVNNDIAQDIEAHLLEPLSRMMNSLLQLTAASPDDQFLAELDAVATKLYTISEQTLERARGLEPIPM
ncbi:hypothetical protein NDA18_005131 [Ustilago nuda]|nr:hypothetical protein NDA18_005131 [Ustilago nuda]